MIRKSARQPQLVTMLHQSSFGDVVRQKQDTVCRTAKHSTAQRIAVQRTAAQHSTAQHSAAQVLRVT